MWVRLAGHLEVVGLFLGRVTWTTGLEFFWARGWTGRMAVVESPHKP